MTASMTRITPEDGQSENLIADNLQKLKSLFPSVINEDGLDVEALRLLLGDEAMLADDDDTFRFTWKGKKRAKQMGLIPTRATLRPCPEDSVDWDTTQNLFIEGDNLEVLKLLQTAYTGQVKMIYIDPPYNKDKDFVYTDRWKDPLGQYLQYTGQVDEDGNRTDSEPVEKAGRRHSNWLNMMYPRLKLAHRLLREDGVIFISIDDDEQANLKKLCEEIFGEENFAGNICWRRRQGQPNDKTKLIGRVAENILVYFKNPTAYKNTGVGKVPVTGKFSNPDNDPRGPWASKPWKSGDNQDGSSYTIISPTGVQFDEEWMGDKETYEKHLADERIYFTKKGNGQPRKKYFEFERRDEGQCATNWWNGDTYGNNETATDDLEALLNQRNVFTNPKSLILLESLMNLANLQSNDLVLDFFAGSGSTSHALMKFNKSFKTNCRCISIQIPEKLEASNKDQKTAYDFCESLNKPHTIAEISKERIRRAAKKIQNENPDYTGDLGMKVFKLDSSNIKPWQLDPDDLEGSLLAYENPILDGRSVEDVLYELLIKQGIMLTTPIDKRAVGNHTLHRVGYGALYACLDEHITMNDVEALAKAILDWHRESQAAVGDEVALDPRVFFRDAAFENDVPKLNLVAILEQKNIKHIKSI